MLRKVDCIMIRVEDVDTATTYYKEVFGLRPVWREGHMSGLLFPDSDTEVVLQNDPNIPPVKIDVNYFVESVLDAVASYQAKGCTVIAGPFDIPIGKCAVIRDPFGTPMTLVDMTKGPRQPL